MKLIEFKIDDEEIKKNLNHFVLHAQVKRKGPRNRTVCIFNLTFKSLAMIERAGFNMLTSTKKVELRVNQDGLKNREFTDDKKQEFKQLLRLIREKHLPEIPCPFTGKIELYYDNSGINLLRFYPSN